MASERKLKRALEFIGGSSISSRPPSLLVRYSGLMGLTLPVLLLLLASAGAGVASDNPSDVFYEALHGVPEAVDAHTLLAAPGRFVGRAVRTQATLVRASAGAPGFALASGRGRVLLRLEPLAAATVAARASSWEGQTVEAVGFFYREGRADPVSRYALRAWQVAPRAETARPEEDGSHDVLDVSLEQLVYGAGRYDGRLVRVRGTYRGANLYNDLPELTRHGPHDWVIKDSYFAAWVTGREARGNGWDLTRQSRDDTDVALEVVGVPTFQGGVIRLAAREVDVSVATIPATTTRSLGLADTFQDPSLAPRVSFTYPVPGEVLRAEGHMIVQFNSYMDPVRLRTNIRIRYERAGAVTGRPEVRCDYRDRYRALVLTPDPPPPPDTDVVVELLEGVVDVEGRALTPGTVGEGRLDPSKAGAVVERLRFRSGP